MKNLKSLKKLKSFLKNIKSQLIAVGIVLYFICCILLAWSIFFDVTHIPEDTLPTSVSPLSAVSPLATPAPNLLSNPDFEGYYVTWGDATNVAWAWKPWWLDDPECRPGAPGCYLPCPDNCKKYLELGMTQTVTISVPSLGNNVEVAAIEVFIAYSPSLYSLIDSKTILPGKLITDGTYGDYTGYVFSMFELEPYPYATSNEELYTLTFRKMSTNTFPVKMVQFFGKPNGAHIQTITSYFELFAPSDKCPGDDQGCYWQKPEFAEMWASAFPYRVYSGDKSQKQFSFGRMHKGGVYQTVPVTAGLWYKASVMFEGWQCYDFETCCDHRPSCISDQPYGLNPSIGIDPTGGTDPLSPNIIWSSNQESFDKWGRFFVVARALTNTLTVFTKATAMFDYARINNDIYTDHSELMNFSPSFVYFPLVMK